MTTLSALSVRLDPGDPGLIWVEGLGFRPAGSYQPGEVCVICSYREMHELPDLAVYDEACDELFTGKLDKWEPEAAQEAAVAALAFFGGATTRTTATPVQPPSHAPGGTTPGVIGTCCVQPTPEPIPAVPLPASGFLLLAAVAALVALRRIAI